MINDLISRKDAERIIHDYFTSLIEKHITKIDVVNCNAELQKRFDNISVAYDIEKVVEQVNAIGKSYCDIFKCNKDCNDCDHGCLMRAIGDIVKGGGINDTSNN